MVKIEMDTLVGNAFIAYLQETGKHVLSLSKIEEFGNNVIKTLEKKGIDAYLDLSRDKTNSFLYEYSEWFTFAEGLMILNEAVLGIELIQKFSGYLSVDALLAFRDKENINVLLK